MNINSTRRGVFRLSMDTLRDDPDAARKIMGECLILRAEGLLMLGAVEYHAICAQFDEVEQGFVIPEYVWVSNSVTGEITAERVEP